MVVGIPGTFRGLPVGLWESPMVVGPTGTYRSPPGTRGWEGQWDYGDPGGTLESQGFPWSPWDKGISWLGIVMANLDMSGVNGC